ncbi:MULTISPECIES: 2Fe-2S iron-sulfur cluster-binding protein [unclassified Streptomyces]|uniref:2Fe-2S iron-sulfur cluster-binding protein n=1 Tax=unclassified Streptomyces TaxID=2593676 RepID=UPI0037F51811
MTDDQHGQGTPPGGGRWDPLPQGDYDDGATAFVKLPEGGIDALLAARGQDPLAAPGHGYVPPRIETAYEGVDPGPEGAWAPPAGGTEWPAPAGGHSAGDDRFTYHPGATGQWAFEDTGTGGGGPAGPAQHPPAAGPGHDVTGQWSIPVVGGDLPDESGEFTTSSLVEQWGGTPPATLPGGAAAPWAHGPAPDAPPWGQDTDGAGAALAAHAPAEAPPADAPSAYGHGQPPYDDEPGRRPYEDGPGRSYEDEPGQRSYDDEPGQRSYDGDAARSYGGAGRAYEDAPEQPYEDPYEEPSEAVAAPPAAPEGEEAAGEPEAAAVPAADRQEPAAADEAAGTTEDGTGADGTEAPADAADAPADATSTRVDDRTDDRPADPEAPDADAAAEADPAPDPEPVPLHDEHPLASYVLRVNGSDRPVTDAWIGESLLYVLRERLGLAGAKDGCSQGECGACNVQVDGRLVASCLVPAVTTAGSEIRTVEGLAVDGQPSDVQRALARCGAVQCGFCVPGMAMTVHDLLEGNPAPTELETRQALCGNLCRCSGYRGVLRAVQDVVAEREAHSAADTESEGDEARIPHQAGPGAGGVHPSAFDNPAQPHPHDPAYGQDGGQA